MVDIKFIRENVEAIKQAIVNKNLKLDLDQLLLKDEKRRELIGRVDALRGERNIVAKNRDIERGKQIKVELETIEAELSLAEEEYQVLMLQVPTIPSSDTPVGKSEDENVEVFRSGEIPKFDFPVKDHIQLAKELDIIDFERGAKVSGYRGYYLKNEGSILVMALMFYAMRKLMANGFTPIIPPTLVKDFVLFGSGYFKGGDYDPEVDEIYRVATSDKDASGEVSKDRKFLVGTAEPSLLAYYSGEVLKLDQLPVKFCGFSPCYRSEIGSYGKDTKGLYRVHEFFKVEQVVICEADVEKASQLHEEMLNLSKQMHEELGLPYRQLAICTGDMSAGKYKQYDLEAWMPGLQRWGETGSASNFLDWQSRRLDVRYQDQANQKNFVYMINNTALASPRTLIAILENHQQADGSVKIPECLVPLTGFSVISPK